MVGLETFPRRMTRFPAISPSVGLVISRSSPISPFSPGARLGHRAISCLFSSAKAFGIGPDQQDAATSSRPICSLVFMPHIQPVSRPIRNAKPEVRYSFICANSLPPLPSFAIVERRLKTQKSPLAEAEGDHRSLVGQSPTLLTPNF